jgi:hypothetical protein
MTHPKRRYAPPEVTTEQRQSDEVIKLIRKLRWIGLERQARQLQQVMEGSPSPHRKPVSTE